MIEIKIKMVCLGTQWWRWYHRWDHLVLLLRLTHTGAWGYRSIALICLGCIKEPKNLVFGSRKHFTKHRQSLLLRTYPQLISTIKRSRAHESLQYSCTCYLPMIGSSLGQAYLYFIFDTPIRKPYSQGADTKALFILVCMDFASFF